ncbi:MAG: hypothetical protein PHC60_09275, partial [Heliobacteriaceae bacterium]|nr:hypothetical protein [Heliobacteriaceae bacterium]
MQFTSPEQALENLVNRHPELLNQGVRVVTRGLPAQEAIGKPARQDYPLLTGKEVLVQAEIGPDKGQA